MRVGDYALMMNSRSWCRVQSCQQSGCHRMLDKLHRKRPFRGSIILLSQTCLHRLTLHRFLHGGPVRSRNGHGHREFADHDQIWCKVQCWRQTTRGNMLDNLLRKCKVPKTRGFRYVSRRGAGLGTCVSLSCNAMLMYFGHHSVVIMAFAALCSWVSYMISDPAMDRLTEGMLQLGSDIKHLEERMDKRMEAISSSVRQDMLLMESRMQTSLLKLEYRVNARFENLQVSLGTAPGTPPGIDEDVMADLNIYAYTSRDDSELRERIAAAFKEDRI